MKNSIKNSLFGRNTKKVKTGKTSQSKNKKIFWKIFKNLFFLFLSLFLILVTVIAIFISTVNIPDFSNFANRKIDNSTKIYDRTGKIILYDIHGEVKRTQVSYSEISQYVKDATIAIEDKYFYDHKGIRPTSIIRAFIANIKSGAFVQGGSTIDQQIIKNALLTREKSIIRKITEWAMAIKLDYQVPKADILTIYLNDASYGGTIYGIQTAATQFFNKDAIDITLAEAAYLAALPNAPTFYSPYGDNVDKLEARKNLILRLMFEQNKISKEEYDTALNEKVEWQRNTENGKAMHFVFLVRAYLEEKYGKDTVDIDGLKVVTTLDYDLQTEAEKIVNKYALENAEKFQATNAGLVAIDPTTGQILSMVGSRDYFETDAIPGNYNVTTALRQPGSAFKPIVYATAFMEGYTPETVLFDVPTQFSTTCDYLGNPLPGYTKDTCYFPSNYDGTFKGPVTIKEALAQSLNIPAVKALYLSGIKNAISTAQKLGITTLNTNTNYGLSLVLGSGEVSLLQLTNAYGVFANNGVYNPPAFILSITDIDGNILEEYNQNSSSVIPSSVASAINSILSDNEARAPLYGYNSGLYFPGKAVAAKTGTTNEYKDTWTIGYSPSIAVGVWAGNNDGKEINRGMSGMVAVPMWSEFMSFALQNEAATYFRDIPLNNTSNVDNNPALNGIYCYSENGLNFSYSVLKPNDSQYNLWKLPADIWMQNTLCPFTGVLNHNGSSTTIFDENFNELLNSSTTINIPNNTEIIISTTTNIN